MGKRKPDSSRRDFLKAGAGAIGTMTLGSSSLRLGEQLGPKLPGPISFSSPPTATGQMHSASMEIAFFRLRTLTGSGGKEFNFEMPSS